MFCKYCGARLPEDAQFCTECGKKLKVEERSPRPTPQRKVEDAAPKTKSSRPQPKSNRPQRRSSRSQEIKPPNFFVRVFLVLLASILLCVNFGSLFVDFIGASAPAKIIAVNMDKRLLNEKYLYSWDVTYEFQVNGKRYVDSQELVGPHGGVNTLGYHVNYLAIAPEVSRLSKAKSIVADNDLTSALFSSSASVGRFCTTLLVSYFLFWVAFPQLPFFGFGGKKKKD